MGIFQKVAKEAFRDMIDRHSEVSRFGRFLSLESEEELIEDLLCFLETSRNLKKEGEKWQEFSSQKSL